MRPYRLNVPEEVLVDLKERLSRTRWPENIPDSGWKYGADLDEVRQLCDHWRTRYDWRAQEARINKWPQFEVNVDGIDIHFIHVRSSRSNAVPLLLLHGWPGSIVEFFELIEPLSDPSCDTGAPAFDLVIPSMPGFGFSGKPTTSGWDADRIAMTFIKLMREHLAYSRFGIQGGDWGTIVGTRICCALPEAIIGLHINLPFAYPPENLDNTSPPVAAFNDLMYAETGYMHLQNTKPDALTLAQTDSPAGLAAWILEKFRAWSDCGGNVFGTFSMDLIITNLMFYWVPNSIASAARAYFESAHLSPPLFRHSQVRVPTGVAAFPKEPYLVPREWLEPHYSIVDWQLMPRGGHFPAMEVPAALVEQVRQFFGRVLERGGESKGLDPA